MRRCEFPQFGVEHLRWTDTPEPAPGPGEVLLRVEAASLNYRDLLVVNGQYNPRLRLPAVPLSDGAGVVDAVGPGVASVKEGDAVMTHFIAGWQRGPYRGEYLGTTLGAPGPGVAAEKVVLPEGAVVPMPRGLTFDEAATLPIAALTAWSALVTEGRLEPGQTLLTLGTGGVSIFALQLGKALGGRVAITSSSDEKLARARSLGADHLVNYRSEPQWERKILELTERRGADVVVETGGAGTLSQSLQAVRAGGVVALLGALTGLGGSVQLGPVLMKRIRVAGILVDSRAAFLDLAEFVARKGVRPVIDRVFPLRDLRAALEHLASGRHFGKIVLRAG